MTSLKLEAPELYLDLLESCLTASIYPESAWQIIEEEPRGRSTMPRAARNLPYRFRSTLQKLLVRQLGRWSLFLARGRKFDPAAREVGGDWPCFGFTMIGRRRLDMLHTCIKDVLDNDVPGDLIETGVWRGGAVIFMRAALKFYGVTDRVVWAADSFEGMPRPQNSRDGWDFSELGYLRVSLDAVKERGIGDESSNPE